MEQERICKLIAVLILTGNLCFAQDTLPYELTENYFIIDKNAYDFSPVYDLVLIEYSNRNTKKDTLLFAKFDRNGNQVAEIVPPGQQVFRPGRAFYKVVNGKVTESTHFDYEINDQSYFGRNINIYDSLGRLVKFESFTAQKGHKWSLDYREENEYDSVNHLTLNVRYDPQWRRRKEFYEYDKQGRELLVKGYEGFADKPSYIVSYVYFDNGYQQIQYHLTKDSLKEIHRFGLNSEKKVIEETFWREFKNAQGKTDSVFSYHVQYQYEYDVMGRIKKKTTTYPHSQLTITREYLYGTGGRATLWRDESD